MDNAPNWDDLSSAAPATDQSQDNTPTPDWDSLAASPKEAKYGTTGQQYKTAAEGMAQGAIGSFAPLIETKILGVKPEDIAGREEVNPWTHAVNKSAILAASMLTGWGEGRAVLGAGNVALHGAAHVIPELAGTLEVGGRLAAANAAPTLAASIASKRIH